jgi:hypothetical protein
VFARDVFPADKQVDELIKYFHIASRICVLDDVERKEPLGAAEQGSSAHPEGIAGPKFGYYCWPGLQAVFVRDDQVPQPDRVTIPRRCTDNALGE